VGQQLNQPENQSFHSQKPGGDIDQNILDTLDYLASIPEEQWWQPYSPKEEDHGVVEVPSGSEDEGLSSLNKDKELAHGVEDLVAELSLLDPNALEDILNQVSGQSAASKVEGEAPTYVNDSIPLGNDADETQQYVPAEELLNTPFMKEALFKEDKAQEEAKSKAVNEADFDMTVPDHPPMTRRQQFKVKAAIKEEKLAKKGTGKGKGKGKGKGGKAAKNKGRKKGKSSAKQDNTSITKKRSKLLSSRTRSSKRATLIRAKSKRNLSESPSSTPQKMDTIKPAEEQALAAARATSVTKKPKVAKDAPVGQSPKPKAKGRSAKAKAKAAAKSTPGKKTVKANAGKTEGDAKKGRKPKEFVPCSDAIQQASPQALGPYGNLSLEKIMADTGEDLVSPVVKFVMAGILKDCRMSGCEAHDLTPVDCAAIRYDMYYKRPAVGIRVKSDLVRHEGDHGDGGKPGKTYMSASYFKNGSCMCTNFGVAQIYVGHFLATWDGSAFLSPGHSSLESLKEVLQATLEATEKEFSTVKVKPATRKKRAASDSGDV